MNEAIIAVWWWGATMKALDHIGQGAFQAAILLLLLVLGLGACALGAAIGWVERRTNSPLIGAAVLAGLLVLLFWVATYFAAI
jgi:hypothetical protein